jgi:hypothetical protein
VKTDWMITARISATIAAAIQRPGWRTGTAFISSGRTVGPAASVLAEGDSRTTPS